MRKKEFAGHLQRSVCQGKICNRIARLYLKYSSFLFHEEQERYHILGSGKRFLSIDGCTCHKLEPQEGCRSLCHRCSKFDVKQLG